MSDKNDARDRPTEDELVQLGLRIPRSLHFALKRAVLEQEQRGVAPATQSEVVVVALRDWLTANGYEW